MIFNHRLKIKDFHHLFMMGMRGMTLVSKFALTFFITKYMNLEDLGLYGLIASGATLVPAFVGLGLNGPVSRHIVGTPVEEAMPLAFSRVMTTLLLVNGFSAIFLLGNFVLGNPISPWLAVSIALVLSMESISADAHSLLIARHKAVLASVLLFIRSGSWPFVFIGLAYAYPSLRDMDVLMFFWWVSLVLVWAVLGLILLIKAYGRYLRLNVGWIRKQIVKGVPFYIFDIGASGSQYIDRFLMSTFLGLEATGIYTFFFSMANTLNSLVYFGITQPFAPLLIGSAKQKNRQKTEAVFKKMIVEVGAWSLGLSVVIIALMPTLLDILNKPQLHQYEWILWVMIVAAVLRNVSDCFNTFLYAHHQDKKMAFISVGGMVISSVAVLVLAPYFGLSGVSVAALLTSGLIFCWRYRVIQHMRKNYLY